MRAVAFTAALLVAVLLPFSTPHPTASAQSIAPPHAQIMSWVPPYMLEQSRQALQHKAGSVTADQWLTRVGLQFWLPTVDGGVRYVTHEEKVDDDVVAWFRTWAREHGVKALLTVYNYDSTKWNWDLARAAFKDNQDVFVKNLVTEMDRQQLDGIDLDLEGNGSLDQDRPAYAAFVAKLSAILKPRGKLLTVDSFHSPCFNAPHMAWWEDWKGQVDAIHSMGYGDLYEGSTQAFAPDANGPGCMNGEAIFKFSWQVNWGKTHGYQAGQILPGLPGGRYEWGQGGKGRTLPQHLDEVAEQGAGICIWDIPGTLGGGRGGDTRWSSEEAWTALKKFRNGS